MSLSTIPYKGTRDFYPEEMKLRNWFFSKIKTVVQQYCYEEYNGPILESFEIYAAKSGEEIAGEQTYNFTDKGGRRLAIRPEMTPTVARMVAGKLGQLTFPLRWYSIPNLMRYERPQKGRLREHWQLNVDSFGEASIKADLEIIQVAISIMEAFGADDTMFKVKINNRKFMNDVLKSILGCDNKVKLVSKALDKRAKISKEEFEAWLLELSIDKEAIEKIDQVYSLSIDQIIELLNIQSEGATELKELFDLIGQLGLSKYCIFDFSVIRGFDYYTGTVFEVYDCSLENKRSLFGGGRYDNLVDIFKEDANVSGVGFGFGDVTFEDFLNTHNLIPNLDNQNTKVLIATFEDVPYKEYAKLASELRKNHIDTSIYFYDKKLRNQFTYAEKNKFQIVLIIGTDELNNQQVVIKDMNRRQEYKVSISEYVEKIKTIIAP